MSQLISLELKNQVGELQRLAGMLENFKADHALTDQVIFDLNLTLEEVLTNVIRYGYRDQEEHAIRLDFFINSHEIKVIVEDDAVPFNPLEAKEPDMTSTIFDRPVGGLGVFLIKKIMREVSYQRHHDKNILTLTLALALT